MTEPRVWIEGGYLVTDRSDVFFHAIGFDYYVVEAEGEVQLLIHHLRDSDEGRQAQLTAFDRTDWMFRRTIDHPGLSHDWTPIKERA